MICNIDPYLDQIWQKSQCRKHEWAILGTLENLVNTLPDKSNTYICLVDAVPENVIVNYRTIITDNILKTDSVQLWPEFWGTFSYDPEYSDRAPQKLFNCFMHRTGVMRQTWFYELIRRELLDLGSVSFLLDYRDNAGYTKGWSTVEEKQALFQWIFEKLDAEFLAEHESIRSLVPYRNFHTDLDQAVVDSKISLVLETYYDNSMAIAFSEKVFRALQLPRPMLLYSGVGAINELRKIGFDLYDDIVDHGYDLIVDSNQRQLDILSRLENFKSFNYTDNTLRDFEQRANKNRNILKNLKQNWPHKLDKIVASLRDHNNGE